MVSAFAIDPASERVKAWVLSQAAATMFVSDWGATEFSAAWSGKVRTGRAEPERRATALRSFARLCVDSLTVLPITREHFRAAARFADRTTLGLRAGDALHLAICADHGSTLCTLDQRLLEAGPVFGVETASP